MYSLSRNLKRRFRMSGFYIGGLLCMIILAIKFFIDKQ